MQKTLLILLAGLFSACSASHYIRPSTYSAPDSRKIILQVDEAPAHAFDHFQRYLAGQGFKIERQDTHRHVLVTDYRSERHFDYCLQVRVVKDSLTHIDLTGRLRNREGKSMPIEKASMNSLKFSAWIQMHKLASGFHAHAMLFSR